MRADSFAAPFAAAAVARVGGRTEDSQPPLTAHCRVSSSQLGVTLGGLKAIPCGKYALALIAGRWEGEGPWSAH